MERMMNVSLFIYIYYYNYIYIIYFFVNHNGIITVIIIVYQFTQMKYNQLYYDSFIPNNKVKTHIYSPIVKFKRIISQY